jgi:hypothetical protein
MYIHMIHFRTKFHMAITNGSLIIAVKLKTKCGFGMAILLFHIL